MFKKLVISLKVLITTCQQWEFMPSVAFPHHSCSYALEYVGYFTVKFVLSLLFEFPVYLC